MIKEQSKIGKVIKTIYQQHGVKGTLFKPIRSRFITNILTRFSGWLQRLKSTPKEIAKTSQSLGITPYEVVKNKSGELLFRGPKYLFGKNIADYKTFNDFFVRDLTEEARADYLRQAKNKNAEILESFEKAKEANLSAVVIASADSRVRVETLEAGELNKPQRIVGKVLNESAAEYAEISGDNPIYYGDNYSFRVSDSLLAKVKDNGEPDYPKMNEPSSSSLDNFYRAQQGLMNLAYEHMNREGVYQIIQRLAPADIHNYTAPVNGRVLNFLEATQFLERKLSESGISKETKKVIENMKKIFSEQDNNKGVVEISGTQYSVSTEAVAQQANILSQNNRKVMIMKHDGIDAYSVHVFIGATGVDQVNVDLDGGGYEQGERTGDMAFGGESKKGKLVSGESIGKFPVNGSTVMSFYFSTLFDLADGIKSHIQAFKNKIVAPELRVKMGDIVLKLKKKRNTR